MSGHQTNFYVKQITHFLDNLQFKDAEFMAERFIAAHPSPTSYALLSRTLFLSGKYHLAYSILKSELGLFQLYKHSESLFLFGSIAVKLKNYEEAIQVFEKCLDLSDKNTSSLQVSAVYSSLAGVYQ